MFLCWFLKRFLIAIRPTAGYYCSPGHRLMDCILLLLKYYSEFYIIYEWKWSEVIEMLCLYFMFTHDGLTYFSGSNVIVYRLILLVRTKCMWRQCGGYWAIWYCTISFFGWCLERCRVCWLCDFWQRNWFSNEYNMKLSTLNKQKRKESHQHRLLFFLQPINYAFPVVRP